MADVKEVLNWANEVCTQALTEARGGNPTLANRIGANSSLKLFFDNVHGIRNVVDSSFPAFYPAQWGEITRLYEGYLQDQEIVQTVDKVAALESKFDAGFNELKAMIAELTEAQKPAKKSKAAKVEVETEVETTEADAESEA